MLRNATMGHPSAGSSNGSRRIEPKSNEKSGRRWMLSSANTHRLDATGEVKRAADRFAVIAAAGELATEWNLTGWRQGEATEAAQRCFREWLGRRGTAGPSDLEMGFRQIPALLRSQGTSRV